MRCPILVACSSFFFFFCACHEQRQLANGDVDAPHEEGRVSVVGTSESGETVRGSTPELQEGDCIVVESQCIDPDASGGFCEREGGPFDVIIADGEVVEVICYPPNADADETGEDTLVVEEAAEGVDVAQNANNATVTFDEATDGTPIEGDMNIDGNNVAVYGNGVDETIIHGDVLLDGNNVRLRGLTIDGNLTLNKNNMAAVFVKVTGNVIINGNTCVLAGSDVYGDLTVTSNNVTLVQNFVQGAFDAGGNNGVCTDNHAFADEDESGTVDSGEIGDDLACD